MNLSTLKPGARAVIEGFRDHTADIERAGLAQRMMEMGLTVGSEIEIAYEAPFGGAIAVRCRGSLVAIRTSDAEIVEVRVI